MGEIADQQIDDYFTALGAGELCDVCGGDAQSLCECSVNKDKIDKKKGKRSWNNNQY